MQIKIFEFNPVCVNTYLLYDKTKEAVIIDCGAFTTGEQQCIREYIDIHNLKPKHLLNTHLHFDHLLGNRFICDTYGLQPEYHESEETLPGLKKQTMIFGIQVDYEPVGASRFIGEGDEIRFGNTILQALLTPGHSPGSLSFYCPNAHCVFTGDALFRHDIGRTDLWGGNEETLIHAIRTRLLTLPDDTIVYPGHGPASTVKEEKQHNPYI
ncbi:MAG: MBL fold metallo-hydrolase [Dysgonamonadaceae bacterium]|jgi:glyoxylase-like metal-dependent hydrolase (beta-lactamase superfamily II)|nr:MBL fold metallo-hydrolase [Dysgonamonadaceae bacterium]